MGASPIITGHGQTAFDSGGAFVPGTQGVLFFTFTDLKGEVYDPSNLTINIYNSDDEVVETGEELDRIEMGIFAYEWSIPSDTPTGSYKAVVTYVVETVDGSVTSTYDQNFVVTETKAMTQFSYRQSVMRHMLESLVGYTQRIGFWDEPVRFNKDRTVGSLSFGKWNQSAGAQVLINGNPRETGFSVDWVKGRLTFDHPVSEYDNVTCSYNFRWFNNSELDYFIDMGLNQINIWPPVEYWTLRTVPPHWIVGVEYAAATNLLRRWLFDIGFAEPAKIFGSYQRAKDVASGFETLKKNYEEMLTKMLEQKKNGPYPTSATITVPVQTLPGGRSRWFRYLFKSGA